MSHLRQTPPALKRGALRIDSDSRCKQACPGAEKDPPRSARSAAVVDDVLRLGFHRFLARTDCDDNASPWPLRKIPSHLLHKLLIQNSCALSSLMIHPVRLWNWLHSRWVATM